MILILLVFALVSQKVATAVDTDEIAAALRARNYHLALSLTDSALRNSRGDVRILTLRGIAEKGLGDAAGGLRAFNEALLSDPKYIPALKGKAELEYNASDPDAARTLQRIVAQQPRDEVAHAMLAAIYFKAHEFSLALSHYESSPEVLEANSMALTEFAQCLLLRHENEKAIAALKRAALLEPLEPSATYNLALAEFLNRDLDGALASLQPLLAQDPCSVRVFRLVSSIYEAQGKTPDAVSLLHKAIVLHPDEVSLYLDFADLSFSHRSFQTGIDMIDAGLRRLPDAAPLYVARGVLWAQLAKYDEASSDFQKAERLDPVAGFGSLAQGVVELQTGSFDRSLSTVETQLKHTPRDPLLYYLKAEALNSKGLEPGSPQLQSAIRAAAEAIHLRPDFPLAEDLLGSLYRKQGNVALARREFESALAHDPDNQSALYHLILLERAGQHRDEIRHLMQRLAEAKQKAQQEAVKASRYQLVETGDPIR